MIIPLIVMIVNEVEHIMIVQIAVSEAESESRETTEGSAPSFLNRNNSRHIALFPNGRCDCCSEIEVGIATDCNVLRDLSQVLLIV